MATDSNGPISAEFGLSAKAQFKAEIKTEVPKESTGRLLDALTDIIRPFTEARGLRADQLRLQREDVLIEIARRTSERIAILGIAPSPIENKILVPLLEQASLEKIDDSEMLDRWAALLVDQATPDSEGKRWVIDVLSSINGEQARFLEMLEGQTSEKAIYAFDNLTSDSVKEYFDLILRRLTDAGSEGNDIESEYNKIIDDLDGYTTIYRGKDIPMPSEFSVGKLDWTNNLAHLNSLGLIWINTGTFFEVAKRDEEGQVSGLERNYVIHSSLTPRGMRFVKIVSNQFDN